MTCNCGGRRVVRLVENVGITICNVCDRGEMIPQPSMAEVSDYRREVNRLIDAASPLDFKGLSVAIGGR